MSEVRSVLWTGGWDSTFRVLSLILVEKLPVQTYYIVDPFRWSVVHELKAMSDIKVLLHRNYPDQSSRLLPTIFFEKTDIRHDGEIAESYSALQSRLGGQYAWLAMWAKQHGVSGVELVIEKMEDVVGCLPVIKDFLVKADRGYVIGDHFRGTNVHTIFRYFLFAVTDMYKIDMRTVARMNRFEELLNLSWFCHRPKFNRLPCGSCNPCVAAYKDGLGDRLGLYGKYVYLVKSKLNLKNYIKKDTYVYGLMKNLKLKFNRCF